jgi:LmbE family N-acetylglucosaminyl deacetylase
MNKIVEKILVVAAHPDDEILGCGGTIAKKIIEDQALVHLLLLSRGIKSRSNLKGIKNKIRTNVNGAHKANNLIGIKHIELLNFPDNQFDTVSRLKIIKKLEKKIANFKPNTIYTHFKEDLNLDHQITCEAVMTATRPVGGHVVGKIFAFEVCSSTDFSIVGANSFKPNHFEDISSTIDLKLNALKFYDHEMRKFPHSRSYENIKNLAKVRGASVYKNYAEAFILLRSIV